MIFFTGRSQEVKAVADKDDEEEDVQATVPKRSEAKELKPRRTFKQPQKKGVVHDVLNAALVLYELWRM